MYLAKDQCHAADSFLPPGKYEYHTSSLLVRKSPAMQCNSQEKFSDRRTGTYGKCYIAKEALSYRQDCPSSFKYDLLCAISPREEKDPRHDTKLLLSATIKALAGETFKLKKLHENVNRKKIGLQRNTVPGNHALSIKNHLQAST